MASTDRKLDLDIDCWGNHDNDIYYTELPIHRFSHALNVAGIVSHVDLRIIDPYIQHAHSILEVGAGVGRVVSYLIDHHPNAEIHALERNAKLFDLLVSKFDNKCHLINQDIMHYQTEKTFDAILLMFATLAEFSAEEQIFLFEKFHSMLSDQGVLCIDLIDYTARKPFNADQSCGQLNTVRDGTNSSLYTYLPSIDDLLKAAKNAGFDSNQCIEYQSETQLSRMMSIFSKKRSLLKKLDYI